MTVEEIGPDEAEQRGDDQRGASFSDDERKERIRRWQLNVIVRAEERVNVEVENADAARRISVLPADSGG